MLGKEDKVEEVLNLVISGIPSILVTDNNKRRS